jgi:hypothetical protein
MNPGNINSSTNNINPRINQMTGALFNISMEVGWGLKVYVQI